MEPKVKKCLIDMNRPCSKHAWTGKKLKIQIIHNFLGLDNNEKSIQSQILLVHKKTKQKYDEVC